MILLTDESTLKKQLLLLTFIAKIAESLIKAGKAMTKPSVGRPKRSSSKMFDQHQPKWRELQKLSFLILIQDITGSLGHWPYHDEKKNKCRLCKTGYRSAYCEKCKVCCVSLLIKAVFGPFIICKRVNLTLLNNTI